MPFPYVNPTATIASGQSLSGSVPLGPRGFTGVWMSAAWTAADMTFQVSWDNVTFQDLYDSGGGETKWTVSAGKFCSGGASDFAGAAYIKIRSGTGSSPVNQGADRALVLSLRQIPNLR